MKKYMTMFLVLFLCAGVTASESRWAPVRLILDGLRDVNGTVESILFTMRESGVAPGQTMTLDVHGKGLTTDSLKTRFSEPGGTYRYFLEVWSLQGSGYEKGIEFSFNDEYSGQLIIRPWLFDSLNYPDPGHYVRVSYNHTDDVRTMAIDVIQSSPWSPETARYLVTSENGFVNVYFTAHTRNSLGGSVLNDAYLFGAIISEAWPHYTTAQYGIEDRGDAYGFSIHGEVNGDNAGLFNLIDGFITDGIIVRQGDYPDPSLLAAGDLPIAQVVENLEVSFASTEGPGF